MGVERKAEKALEMSTFLDSGNQDVGLNPS
jgi:hypothetical protein